MTILFCQSARSEGLRLKAVEAFEAGQDEEALKYIQKSLKLDPENVKAKSEEFRLKAVEAFEKEKYEDALTYIQKSLELDPGGVKALLRSAMTKAALGDYLGAVEDKEEAQRIYRKLGHPEIADVLQSEVDTYRRLHLESK
ncbi:MAG: tetratricopeptide repeat protein [Cyanobacteria bacterium J06635_15]